MFQKFRDEIGESGEKGNIDRILEKMEENEYILKLNALERDCYIRRDL